MNRILGLVALVIGVVLLVFAYQSSNAPVDQISSAQTMWYLIAGIVLALTGGLVSLFGSRGQ